MQTNNSNHATKTKSELQHSLITSEKRIKSELDEAEKCLRFIKQEFALNNINNCIEVNKLLVNCVNDLLIKFLANQSMRSVLQFYKLQENSVNIDNSPADAIM